MPALDPLLLISSLLIIISVIAARVSHSFGLPALLLFLALGMFAGEEGPGKIVFNDRAMAQSISTVALVFILFAGGLDTQWKRVRRVALHSASLATVGVLVTALIAGFAAMYIFGLPLYESLLIGAIISSTDAAAVFAVLRSRELGLKGDLQPLLEMESGSNDPMAVFLTVGFLQLIYVPESPWWLLIPLFFVQMGIGLAVGLGIGKGFVYVLNRLRLPNEGYYPVFAFACAVLAYSMTSLLAGSGFLAVYVAGLVIGNSNFVQKKTTIRFFDGVAWLSQIAMFVTLGLLVTPSHLVPVVSSGILLAFVLFFIARPVSVFISLISTEYTLREKLFISWVGLRGAVPIILATFPVMLDPATSGLIFNVVFFIVLLSALLQGWPLAQVARLLKVQRPLVQKTPHPLEVTPEANLDYEMVDLIVPYRSAAIGKAIAELNFPEESNVVLVGRDNRYIVPSGSTLLEAGDTLLMLVNKENISLVKAIISEQKPEEEK